MIEREESFHPEVRGFIDRVKSKKAMDRWGFVSRDYGHAASNLAYALALQGSIGVSQEEQLRILRSEVEQLVGEFGENIIPLLTDELQDALKTEGS